METRNIIVIGASAGGLDALKKLVAGLPQDLDASLFVVWHTSPSIESLLPGVLDKAGSLPASYAVDKEIIEPRRIYVAPSDFHLLIERGRVRITKGPKENRFRPAVDPLFRSAAYSYGSRVIGVILSGSLDDGTSGLWTIKYHGGTAVVQAPQDAEFPSMPESALREVNVDYSVPISEMADLLVRLSKEQIETSVAFMEDNKLIELEIAIAKENNALESGIMSFGELTPYTCPECHGVLVKLKDGDRIRFRCHTGHAFSSDSLLATITETIEESLWSAIRGIEESVMLLNQMGSMLADDNQINLSTLYFKKAFEAEERMKILRQAVMKHERLSSDGLRRQSEEENGNIKASGDN